MHNDVGVYMAKSWIKNSTLVKATFPKQDEEKKWASLPERWKELSVTDF